MTDKETLEVYNSSIDKYVELVKRDKPDPVLLAFIEQISPRGYVLDLGCGPAWSSAVMRDHGLRVDPVDASGKMVELANKTYAIGARQATFMELSGTDIYDGVWANFSLLHAPAEEFPLILGRIAQALKHAGTLHLGMKTGQGSKRDRLGRFYSYYSEDELVSYLQQYNFNVDYTKQGEGKGLAGNVEPWIELRSTLTLMPRLSR